MLTDFFTVINLGCLTSRYQFSDWDASLNEITQGQRGRLPPSDARFRPDVRAIEDGRFTEVSAVKMHTQDIHARQEWPSLLNWSLRRYGLASLTKATDSRPDGICQQCKYSGAHA